MVDKAAATTEEALPPRPPVWTRLVALLRRLRWGRVTAAAAVTLGLVVAIGNTMGGIAALWEVFRTVTGQSAKRSTTALTDRPFRSIAVLPFEPVSRAPEDEEMSREVHREITTAARLAAIDGYLASHGLVQQYKDSAHDLRRLGEQLNVRYVLGGQVRRKGSGHQLVLELTDTLDGQQLWEDRIALGGRPYEDAAAKVRNHLSRVLDKEILRDIQSLPKEKRQVWELYQQARQSLARQSLVRESREQERQPQRLIEDALRIDPDHVPSLTYLGFTLLRQRLIDPELKIELAPRIDEISSKLTRLAPTDFRAWVLRAYALPDQHNPGAMLGALDEALRLDPYRSNTLAFKASWLVANGRAAEGLAMMERALEIDPESPNVRHFACETLIALGRSQEALPHCEKAAAITEGWYAAAMLAAAYANLDQSEAAERWKRKALKANPKVTIAVMKGLTFGDNPGFRAMQAQNYWGGLRKAGFPEK
jgi:TolB-like protein